MKRVDLTSKQLEEVIRHRQSGLSWLGIQNATGISRRVAQRSYEQWERARSVRELENVRVKVGEIEFKGHLDVLTRLAQNLVEHLSIPDYRSFSRDAEAHLTLLMEREIIVIRSESVSTASQDRVKARNIRRNKLLFESLQTHTAGKIRWDSLNNWMEGWDTCAQVFPKLKTITKEIIRTTFSQFPDFDEWFVTGPEQNKPSEILEEGVRNVLWQTVVAGKMNTAAVSISSEKVELPEEGEVLRITIGNRSLLQRGNREMDPSVTGYCQGVVNELWNTSEAKEIIIAVERMKGVVAELEAVLEPLVLRPLILHTRCRICPA